MKSRFLHTSPSFTLLSCLTGLVLCASACADDDPVQSDPEGDGGASGAEDTSCSVTTEDDGSITIECPDGTEATVEAADPSGPRGSAGDSGTDDPDGNGGMVTEGCTATPGDAGTWLLDCPGGETFEVEEKFTGRFVHATDSDDLMLATVVGDQVDQQLLVEGNLSRHVVSREGQLVIYSDGSALHAIDLSGGAPYESRVVLSSLADYDAVSSFMLSPDSTLFAFKATVGTATDAYVARVPESGEMNPRAINPSADPTINVNRMTFSDDSSEFIYIADADTDGNRELYVSDVSGNRPKAPVKLNPVFEGDVTHFALVDGGARVVYRADQDASLDFELFVVDVDAPQDTAKINDTLPVGADVENLFDVVGNKVIYVADQETYLTNELFVVDISGATPGKSNKISQGGIVDTLSVSAESELVAFRTDFEEAGIDELYVSSVARANPSDPVKVNQELGDFGNVVGFTFSPDGSKIAYTADPFQDFDNERNLYVVDLKGPYPSAPLMINPTHLPFGTVDFESMEFLPGTDKILYAGSFVYSGTRHYMLSDADTRQGPAVMLNYGTWLLEPMDYVD